MNGNTILVIDTDTEMIQKIMLALESEGYLFFTASSQDVSINMAKKVNPSLILINIGIEGASGLEICKAIHKTKTLENVPIVIITPHEGRIDSRYTALYGIVDFLKKPFSDEELILKTKNIISVIPVEGAVKEEMSAQPFEDETDMEILEEEGITVEPVEEAIKTQPIEEEVSVQP